VLLNGRSRICNSLTNSPAATCEDFACGIREIGGYFVRSRKTGSKLAEM
jgi:hypothetical protein